MARWPEATFAARPYDNAGGAPLASLVGDGALVPCVDGQERPYLSCDAAASTAAFPSVLAAVEDFLPWYSSVHRGAGYKSQRSTDAYEAARGRRPGASPTARAATTWPSSAAIRPKRSTISPTVLRLSAGDVVVTTVVEHHANMLPWSRAARCRYVECGRDGTFEPDDVVAALEATPAPGSWPSRAPPTSPGGCRRWTSWSARPMTAACP